MDGLNWHDMTNEERIRFCDEHCPELRTCLDWDDLSPTSQLLLKLSGISTPAIFEV